MYAFILFILINYFELSNFIKKDDTPRVNIIINIYSNCFPTLSGQNEYTYAFEYMRDKIDSKGLKLSYEAI